MKKLILNNKINTSVFAFIIAVSANSSSHATVNSTYIGADVIYTKTRFQSGFGDNVFSKKMAPGVNLFAGLMFNKYLGGEIGFEVDDPNSDINYAAGSEAVFGIASKNAFLNYVLYKNKLNQNHGYFGITVKTALFNKNLISVLIGGSISNFRAKTNLIGENLNDALDEPYWQPNDNVSIFNKTKLIPLAKITFEHKYNNNYSVKFYSSWKNTSKITIKSKDSPNNNPEIIKFKNTINIGVGFSYYI
ncbi:MAG: hypothetical protein ABSA84_05090 [Gammaproteobacteria bacterium]